VFNITWIFVSVQELSNRTLRVRISNENSPVTNALKNWEREASGVKFEIERVKRRMEEARNLWMNWRRNLLCRKFWTTEKKIELGRVDSEGGGKSGFGFVSTRDDTSGVPTGRSRRNVGGTNRPKSPKRRLTFWWLLHTASSFRGGRALCVPCKPGPLASLSLPTDPLTPAWRFFLNRLFPSWSWSSSWVFFFYFPIKNLFEIFFSCISKRPHIMYLLFIPSWRLTVRFLEFFRLL
jgi:hypothetical protein